MLADFLRFFKNKRIVLYDTLIKQVRRSLIAGRSGHLSKLLRSRNRGISPPALVLACGRGSRHVVFDNEPPPPAVAGSWLLFRSPSASFGGARPRLAGLDADTTSFHVDLLYSGRS